MEYILGDTEPNLDKAVNQLCTPSQFFSLHYKYWCKEMGSPLRFAGKQWEFIYLMQVLNSYGMLAQNKRDLGFGCGFELLPRVFTKHGCNIVATDLAESATREQGWVDTLQHANNLEDLYNACNWVLDKILFLENITFEIAARAICNYLDRSVCQKGSLIIFFSICASVKG